MFDELWSEIQDSQGEIFDVIEYKEEWEKEEKFDVEKYINGNTDYWEQWSLNKAKYQSSVANGIVMLTLPIMWLS